MQADIQTSLISKNNLQSAKDREAQRREKQRQDTAVPKKVQRFKLERAVRYRRSVLDAWMSAHDHSPDKRSFA